MENLTKKEIGIILKEISEVEKIYLQERALAAVIISNNYKAVYEKKLPIAALLLLDLEISGNPGVTVIEDLVSDSLRSLGNSGYERCIKEEVLILPIGHLLRVTPIADIIDGIRMINMISDLLKITDMLGILPRLRKSVNGKEYLNPSITSINIKGCFNINQYIN